MIPEEGQKVEVKESLSDWRAIVESCAAFGTGSGGRVYVGVTDNGRPVGVTIGKGTLEDLANKIGQNTSPKLVPEIATEVQDGKTIILIQAHESRPRNKLVADAFFLVKYIEQFGTGTGRMIRLCRDAGVPEPEFESRGGTFRIVFRMRAIERRTMDVNDRQAKVLDFLVSERRTISRTEYESIAGVSARTAKRDLNLLVKQGILKMYGSGKSVRYGLPETRSIGDNL